MSPQNLTTLDLTNWLLQRAAEGGSPLTHLKLQKLYFYTYGALLGHGVGDALEDSRIEAWKYGPVSPDIYHRFKAHKAEPLPTPDGEPSIPASFEEIALQVVNVYGRLSARELVAESHLEAPWRDTFSGEPGVEIPREVLRQHFAQKFHRGTVVLPEMLFRTSSLALDGIPVPRFKTLGEMSRAVSIILDAA